MAGLPEHGRSRDEVLADLEALKAKDVDWRAGKVFSLVYSAGDEVHELHAEALALYSAENGLNQLAFPSLALMEADIVAAARELLAAGVEGVAGWLTSGGTESLLQVMKVARDLGHERGIARPRVVAARSAHAAFSKAAELFGLELVRTEVGDDLAADASAFEAAIDEDTVMLVGSAPCYPHGVIDPIEEIAGLAASRGLLCHVDACMGGFLLPFLSRLGRELPAFDLSVEGVTSISADVHKYGYASKGASVVLYADRALARRQVFVTDDWSGGFYGSTVLAGSRPAGPVAAAWATLQHLGLDGYLRLAEATMLAADELRAGIEAIDGICVLGDPDMAVMAVGAEDPDRLDVFAVGDRLKAAGWWLDRQEGPDALHLTVHAGSAAAVPGFLNELAEAVVAVGSERAASRDTTYSTAGQGGDA